MPEPTPGAPMTREQKEILATLLVPAFMSLLAVSIINVTLPAMQASLHAGTSGLQWAISGYALVFGVLLVPSGRAGDVYGRGRLFVAGLACFGLGALGAGLAPSILVLNLARLLMGVGSGLLNPQVTGMIQHYFRGEHRGRAFGAFGAVVGISVAVGPILGGGLIALLGPGAGWRWSLLINAPIAAIGIIAAWRLLPRSAWQPSEHRDAGGRVDLDPVGMVLLAASTVLLMIPFMELRVLCWWSALVLALGVALAVAWVRWEQRYGRRGREPMVDMELFRTRSFAGGALLIGIYFMAYTSVWLLVAQYMQLGVGHGALVAGIIGLPSALLGAVAAPWAGRRIVRTGRVMVVWGLVIVVAGMLLSALVAVLHRTSGVSEWWLLVTLGVVGLGQGLVVSPNQALTLTDVPLRYAGSAGGVLQTGQRIGTAIGIAIITSLAFGVVGSLGWDWALAIGLLAVSLVIGVSLVVGLVDLRNERAERRAAASSPTVQATH